MTVVHILSTGWGWSFGLQTSRIPCACMQISTGRKASRTSGVRLEVVEAASAARLRRRDAARRFAHQGSMVRSLMQTSRRVAWTLRMFE